MTPEFADKFSTNDVRYKFYTDGQSKVITDIGSFNSGWGYIKFTNLKDDGSMIENANSFPDTDFPMFRLADVYLMLAECQVVGGATVNVNGHDGIWYFNQIRHRAGIAELENVSAQNILDERARELSWECWRRSDLIRFNKFTNNYIWSYKGMNSNSGAAHNVDSKYALFPIPAKEISNNGNLQQNPGY